MKGLIVGLIIGVTIGAVSADNLRQQEDWKPLHKGFHELQGYEDMIVTDLGQGVILMRKAGEIAICSLDTDAPRVMGRDGEQHFRSSCWGVAQ